MTDSPIAPLAVREQFMIEPDLGAGNFLDYAVRANPNRTVPFLYSHTTDHRGEVVLRGHSLVDLAALRDRYAKWYWANGVRPGEPVGIVVAEGMEPLLHFLALTALGAIPAMINDAMRPDVMVRYLNYVGVVGVVADDTTRLASAYRADPQRRPRFIALAAEVQAFDADSASLPDVVPVPAPGRRRRGAHPLVGHHRYPEINNARPQVLLGRQAAADGPIPGRALRQADVAHAAHARRRPELLPDRDAARACPWWSWPTGGARWSSRSWRRSSPPCSPRFPRTFVELATGELPVKGAAKVHSWFNTGRLGPLRPHPAAGDPRRAAGRADQGVAAAPRTRPMRRPLPGSQFIDGLGSTEMGMALFGGITTPETPRNDRCVGKAQPAVEKAAVLDDDGNEVPDGTVGLLAVKTPSRTPGYWKNPRLTSSFELAGYWLTGDVARTRHRGQLLPPGPDGRRHRHRWPGRSTA